MLIKVPLSWLKEYVDVTVSTAELAALLHMSGTEVDKIERPGDAWDRVWVGRIAALDRHPNADRLQLATVEYGRGRVKTVVTGATNLVVGAVVPYAETGSRLRDGHGDGAAFMTLEPRKVRGVMSEGMVCSAKELGLGDDHDGILLLDPALPVGAPLAEALGDPVLHLELQPNRPDCLGVVGVAREVAALLRTTLREPALAPVTYGTLPSTALDVRIEDPGCVRFTAAVLENVRLGPSPEWMQRRLAAAGMRPIDAIVDVTNYVMLEFGQPLHAYDARKLRGNALVARRATAGERLRTLDDVDRTLAATDLVIADAERPLGLAGVIGGEDSEISPATRTVALECASFEPRGIGRTATAHLATDVSAAARRFMWPLSADLPALGLARAVQLLTEHAGATLKGATDVYPAPRPRPSVSLPAADFKRVLGMDVSAAEARAALERLQFAVRSDGATLTVMPPAVRTDIAIPEDVVEEVARLVGYDRLPTTIPAGELPLHERHPLPELRERARDLLVGFGLTEIVAPSLIDPAWLEMLGVEGGIEALPPLRVENPTSVDRSAARTTLRASLLDAARRNLRQRAGVALFECAPVYLPRAKDLPEERQTLALVLAGQAEPARDGELWLARPRPYDLHDVRGVLDALAAGLGLQPKPGTEVPAPGLHPSRSRSVERGGVRVITFGQIDPRVAERWELPEATFLAEIDLAGMLEEVTPRVATAPSRYPAAYRDAAFVVEEQVGYGDLEREIRASQKSGLESVALLDVYRGPQAGQGKKSFAVRLVFRSDDGTLADADLEKAMRRIEGRLAHALGAVVR